MGGLGTAPGDELAGCRQPGNPPGDIASALRVPVTSVVTSPAAVSNAGAGDFDLRRHAAHLRAGSPRSSATTAPSSGPWAGRSSRPRRATADPELLFQKAGSDTFYWVVGVTVERAGTATTSWTYTVYQNSSSI